MKKHNPNWLQIPDYSYRTLIIGGSGSVKTNLLLSLVSHQQKLIKFIFMLKTHMKQNNQFLINKIENTGLKHLNDSKAFIEYSNDMDDIYKNIEEYNPNKRCKILIVLMILLLIELIKET